MTWEADFWKRVRQHDAANTPRDPVTGKVIVNPATEDCAVIADPKAHTPLPGEVIEYWCWDCDHDFGAEEAAVVKCPLCHSTNTSIFEED